MQRPAVGFRKGFRLMSDFLWNAIILIVSLGVMVLVHELGHFLVAKRSKIGVLEFAVGMGPALFSIQRGETLYSIRAIPLGGFCRMEGEDENEKDNPAAFHNHPKYQRFLTLVAGGMMNLLLGFVAMSLLFCTAVPMPTNQIDSVIVGSSAEDLGLQKGDRLVAVDGVEVLDASDFSDLLFDRCDKPFSVTVERDGTRFTLDNVSMTVPEGGENNTPMFGVVWTQEDRHIIESTTVAEIRPGSTAEKAGLLPGDRIVAMDGKSVKIAQDIGWHFNKNGYETPYSLTVLRDGKKVTLDGVAVDTYAYTDAGHSYVRTSLGYSLHLAPQTLFSVVRTGFYYTGFMMKAVLSSLWELVSGAASFNQMTGLVGISGELGAAAKRGIADFLMLFGMLSINLGLINLLPLPALDGGRILFLLVEAIRGKPIPPEREGLVHGIGFLLLILLAVAVNINDIIKLWS